MRYLIVLLLLSGCYSAKKAEKQLNKAIDEFPEVAAKITREQFPCIEKSVETKTDTVYSLVELECPPVGVEPAPATITDTVWKERVIRLKPGRQVVYLPGQKITETIRIEDSAKVLLANSERDVCKNELEAANAKADRRGRWALWLLLALVMSWVFFIFNKNMRLW